jgi:MFS transporter, LPLT family, lysophospholipid transporter
MSIEHFNRSANKIENTKIRGFFIILAAQFFSSLGDNCLLFAAIELLKELKAPAWQIPILQQLFVVAFILLAPFVGPFADAMPKGKIMLISNSIKISSCLALFLGVHPLLAYGFVGLGSALYSPAKYGILTEYLPSDRLVWANSWMEGLTVAAIIFGAILGGLLISDKMETIVSNLDFIFILSVPEFAILNVLGIYLLATFFNLYIPKLPIEHSTPNISLSFLLMDFGRNFLMLWRDPLGQVSLAVTSLFWGVGTTLRFIILVWAASALHLNLQQATQLTAVVAVGIAIGSVIAAKRFHLSHAVNVLPLGIAMGIFVMAMAWITDWRQAICMLIVIGMLAGSFVIPMNALLQYRGHLMMGSGRSIALQNFNENVSILIMLGAYAVMIRCGLNIIAIVIFYGLFTASTMALLYHWHGRDQD